MRKALILLFLLTTYLVRAQHNPDGNRYSYSTLQEAIDAAMKVGQKITVDQKGVGGDFVVKATGGSIIPDTAIIFDKQDGTALMRINTQSQAINAGWFGMVGDGVTNNYTAFQHLVSWVNRKGGNVTINFEPGTYYIDTFKIIAGPNRNTITDMVFTNCKNIKILGYGATISVRGNFKRTADGGAISYENEVIPLEFANCRNVSIEGIELYGNVDKMTKDTSVTEGLDNGIMFYGGFNVNIKNVYVHHFASDGLYITGTGTPMLSSRNFTVENLKSYYNGRQGMSITGLYNATFNNCEFSYTADSIGNYGGHQPRYGVDIEPNFVPPAVDVLTSEITFNNCQFVGNEGACISAAGVVNSTKDIFINGGTLDNSLHNFTYAVIMGIDNFVIQNADINTGTGRIYPVWGTGVNQKSALRNNRITTQSEGILAATTPANGCAIEGNYIIGQHASSFAGNFPYIFAGVAFRNNTIFVPKAIYGGNNSGLIQNCILVENNNYNTDMDTTGGKIYFLSYSGSKTVRNETFQAATPLRPNLASSLNTSNFGSNAGNMTVGGTQTAATTFTPSATAMSSLQLQNGGVNIYTGSNLIPGSSVTLNKTTTFDSSGTQTISIPATSSAANALKLSQIVGANTNEFRFSPSTLTLGAFTNNVAANMAFNANKVTFNSTLGIGAGKAIAITSNDGTNGSAAVSVLDNSNNFYWDIIGTHVQEMMTTGRTVFFGPVNPKSYTVATLPTPFTNDICFVTDALNPTNGQPVVGGGTTFQPVYRTATQWIAFGAGTASTTYTNGYGLNLSSNTFSVDSTKLLPNRGSQSYAGNNINSLYVRPSSSTTLSELYVQDTFLTKKLFLYNGLQGGNPTISNSRNNRAFDFDYVGGVFGLIGNGTFDYTMPAKNGTLATLADIPASSASSAIAQDYTGSFTSDGTAASSPASLKYSWSSDGKLTTLKIRFKWNTPSTNMTVLDFPLPSGMPVPAIPADVTQDNGIITNGSILLQPSNNLSSTIGNYITYLKRSASSTTGFMVEIAAASFNYQGFFITLIYQNQ